MAARLDAAAALMCTPFIGGMTLVLVMAVWATFRWERYGRRREQQTRNPYMAPWETREPGQIGDDQ